MALSHAHLRTDERDVRQHKEISRYRSKVVIFKESSVHLDLSSPRGNEDILFTCSKGAPERALIVALSHVLFLKDHGDVQRQMDDSGTNSKWRFYGFVGTSRPFESS